MMFQLYSHELPFLEKFTDHVKSTPTFFFSLLHGISCHIGKCRQTSKQCVNIIKTKLHHVYCFSHYICITYYIRKCAQTMQRIHQHCWQWSTSHISIFSDFFSDFSAIFTLIATLGNAHRPCKLYLNMINNSASCLSFFSWFFLIFLIIFTLLTILGNAHRPCLHSLLDLFVSFL